jgi:hypothetical protein
MTGPPYPEPPSSAIGSFVIGVSAIGSQPTLDWWDTVISQYANSPTLTALIGSMSSAIDLSSDMDSFYDNLWNINTASGESLDVWGRILGVNRVVNVANPGRYLGFDEATTVSGDPFNISPFYSGSPITNSFALSDTAYRTLLFAKCLANITDGSVKSINALLRALFPGRGNCYVVDGLNLTMTYTFAFHLSAVELAIVSQTGVLPRTSGVLSSISVPP